MKQWRWILLVWAIGLAGDASAQSIRAAIAFVDFDQVFTNYFKAKLANDQLKEMADSINRERAEMMVQFDETQKEFKELQSVILTAGTGDAETVKLRKNLDDKLISIRQQEEKINKFNQVQQKRWEDQNRRIRDNLVEEIRKKMAEYLKTKGYMAVVDSSQVDEKNVPSVLYLDPKVDITQDVIDELNK